MSEPRPLQCMELIGGLGRRTEHFSVKGLEAFLLAEPMPGATAGGDVQYASMCSAGRISRFAVADVSGHGDEVAHFGLRLRDLMRRFINTPSQERMVRELNNELRGSLDAGVFATAVIVTWFDPTRQAYVCAAGHPAPLWYSAELDQWTPLDSERFQPSGSGDLDSAMPSNLPLGIIEGTEYEQFTVPLADGDLLVLYTDHYIEAADPEGRRPGVDGLLRLARNCPTDTPESFALALDTAVDAHLGGGPIEDDRSLLVVRADARVRDRFTLLDRLRGALLSLVPAAWVRSRPAQIGVGRG